MIETKILFLDIDGVLATDECFNHKHFMTSIDGVEMPYCWNEKCCVQLQNIIISTKCKIVLSSDWGKLYSLDDIKTMFEYYYIDYNSLIGFTDRVNITMSGYNRNAEVKKWVHQHRISKWCVVDDILLNLDNFIHIQDTSLGLTKEKANKIIEILNGRTSI